jgi:hypothetical protein
MTRDRRERQAKLDCAEIESIMLKIRTGSLTCLINKPELANLN